MRIFHVTPNGEAFDVVDQVDVVETTETTEARANEASRLLQRAANGLAPPPVPATEEEWQAWENPPAPEES